MSWLTSIIHSIVPKQALVPDQYKEVQQGFYWQAADAVSLVAGRGFNQQVVGESFYRGAFEQLANGKTINGVNVSCAVELRQGLYEGKETIELFVDGLRCGSIAKEDVPDLLRELKQIVQPEMRTLAKGRIAHGYQGGDYSLRLSISRPLKLRQLL